MAIVYTNVNPFLPACGDAGSLSISNTGVSSISAINQASGHPRTAVRGVRFHSECEAIDYASGLEFEIEQLRRNLANKVFHDSDAILAKSDGSNISKTKVVLLT